MDQERPEAPDCRTEISYWLLAVEKGVPGEDAEKASRKLRCYLHNCRNLPLEEAIQFRWCCKKASPDYGDLTRCPLESVAKEARAYLSSNE
ncbi:hypothetical protein DIPPA_23134 [Diplonema papillatum]|nr:hypothetical protein DIPPA_23134 [Diplonema papillatum]KAJ9462654.1 hypothetical protein DIPPA_23134 [Diplonema papillatum]